MNTIKKISLYVFFISLFFMGSFAHANAGVLWNTFTNDHSLAMSKNNSLYPNTNTNYAVTTSGVEAGQYVAVHVYFHNTGDITALGTRVTISPQTTSTGTTHNFSVTLGSSNSTSISSSTTVYTTTAQTLTFIPGSVKFYRYNQGTNLSALPNGQSGSELFSGGLILGDIPGWNTCPATNSFCEQGSVVALFQVSNTQTASYQCSDGIDNDGDGKIDYPTDPGCSSSTDNDEYNAPVVYACSDNIDNDGDGLVDYPNDPGCSSATDNDEYNAPAQCIINSFYANPTTVQSGGYTTLSWQTTGCTSVTIDGISYPADGSGSFGPLYNSRNYQLIGVGPGTPSQQVSVTVIQQQSNPCVINSFSAYQSSVAYGSSTTLSWSTSNCTSANINGNTVNANSGTWNTPNIYGSTAFTLSASGSAGSATPQTIYVTAQQQQQQCSIDYFSASSSSVTSGQSVTFSWSTTGASSATLDGPNVYNINVGTNSSYTVYPTTSGTYTLTINCSSSSSHYSTKFVSVVAAYVPPPVNNVINNPPPVTIINNPPATTVINNPAPTTVVSGGVSNPLVQLRVENQNTNVCVADNSTDRVFWKNISSRRLSKVVLQISLSKDAEFKSSTGGIYNNQDRTVTLDIGTLDAGEEGQIFITTQMLNNLSTDNSLVVLTATLSFETASNSARQTATAYGMINSRICDSSALGGLALFGNGFFPTTLIGWLLLALLIVGLVWAARRLARPTIVRPL